MDGTLTCAALETLLAERTDIAVLDVRRRLAFEAEPQVIPGALWRDPDAVAIWAEALNRNRPVVVYCVHGHEVSQGVVGRLRARGIEALLLEGGLEGWKVSGRPLSPTESPRHEMGHA